MKGPDSANITVYFTDKALQFVAVPDSRLTDTTYIWRDGELSLAKIVKIFGIRKPITQIFAAL